MFLSAVVKIDCTSVRTSTETMCTRALTSRHHLTARTCITIIYNAPATYKTINDRVFVFIRVYSRCRVLVGKTHVSSDGFSSDKMHFFFARVQFISKYNVDGIYIYVQRCNRYAYVYLYYVCACEYRKRRT